jgi:pyruvate/2-oxoglutarate dehydrogenase complex dihydrolipoamide acyltransferase (E2) component
MPTHTPGDQRWVQTGTAPSGDVVYSRVHGAHYYEDIETTGAAAELAQELGVDLSTVEGTGKDGRITKADVEAAAKSD